MKTVILNILSLTVVFLFIGCAYGLPKFSQTPDEKIYSQLEKALDDYYMGSTYESMRGALQKIKTLVPGSGIYHETASDYAYLTGDREGRFLHLTSAVLDPELETTPILLNEIGAIHWTYDERETVKALYEKLADDHPDASVRSIARRKLAAVVFEEGNEKKSDELILQLDWKIPFSIIGPWDNEQGKGFEIAYPPEKEIKSDASYLSENVNINWRHDLPLGRQNEVDFYTFMFPDKWAVAYAFSQIDVAQAGEYELRVATTDGLKIWVNENLVFADRNIGGWTLDAVKIPVSLKKGVNRILIKTSQKGGGWDLFARLTLKDGKIPPDGTFTSVGMDAPFISDKSSATIKVLAGEDMIENFISSLKLKGARADYWKIQAASHLNLDVERVELAEKILKKSPHSIRQQFELALALWTNQERGRTSDLLEELSIAAGDHFVEIPLKRARFWEQNNLEKKSRELLLKLKDKHMEIPWPLIQLSKIFSSKGWPEDSCFEVIELNKKWPEWPRAEKLLASCYSSMDFDAKAKVIYDKQFKKFPGNYRLLNGRYGYAMGRLDYAKAEEILRKIASLWPVSISSWNRLGDLLRSRDKIDEAEKVWKKIIELCPTCPTGYYNLASLSYFEGGKIKAVKLWKEAFLRDPSGGHLSERLEYLAPSEREQWADDVPDELEIDEAVEKGQKIKRDPAADMGFALDHRVTGLKVDGSSVNVNTTVLTSFNVSGRDALTEYRVPCMGRSRILHAYSVDPAGKRSEASSIRNNVIRFRKMKVGSTIVVQNRCERKADDLIGNYFSDFWSFQSLRKQFLNSTYILWAPQGTLLKESVRGDVTRDEKKVGDLKRYSWIVNKVPVLEAEAGMPPLSDVRWRLALSTIPDWDVFLKWEKAILQDVFRASPEVKTLAEEIFADTKTPMEKILKIQSYLQTNIRYQQDYENFIAGVKPHAAPMVIARGYGDCKDKAVLFITLAKLADISAHFALVRTRGVGKIIFEVPYQQFNHAIVYIPKQKGVDKGHFYDPTVDMLDLGVTSQRDAGTTSYVFDERADKFEWIEIPFQKPAMNFGHEEINLKISPEGEASGEVIFKYKGYLAALFRKLSRNRKQFLKTMQVILSDVINGSSIENLPEVDLKDIDNPVEIPVTISSPTFAHVSGKEMKFSIPFGDNPEKQFSLNKRIHPLLFPLPMLSTWKISIKLPEKSKIEKKPDHFSIDTDCMTFSRKIKAKKGRLDVEQKLTIKCERVMPEDYGMLREEVLKLRRAIDEQVVVKLKQ